tara:strand:- start:3027 stop:3620 length:594 start_codon:yes stop_codon:yes gene_type:complete
MTKIKITNGQLRLLKKHILRENERITQDIASKKQSPFKLRRKKEKVSEEDEQDNEGPAKKAKPVTTEKMSSVPTYDIIKKKLNIIRSGKSLDDDEVASNLQSYFEDLTDAEKLGLFAFLKAFGEIISGGESAEQVHDPDDAPYKVSMTMSRTGGETKEAPAKARKKERVAVAKDTPIVVGESASGKERLLKLIKSNR